MKLLSTCAATATLLFLNLAIGHSASASQARPAGNPVGPIPCINPAACGITTINNVHELDTSAFAYSAKAVSIPEYQFTQLDNPLTITCNNKAGCTVVLDATVTIHQIGPGQNAWAIDAAIDTSTMIGTYQTAGETLQDGNDTTVTEHQYLQVSPGTHTARTYVISFHNNAIVDYYGIAYHVYNP